MANSSARTHGLRRQGKQYCGDQRSYSAIVAALQSWPRWDVPGYGPTAVFSIVDAKTRIPPHNGVHNTRLTVHLPLIIPPGCGFRVGGERREWVPG